MKDNPCIKQALLFNEESHIIEFQLKKENYVFILHPYLHDHWLLSKEYSTYK